MNEITVPIRQNQGVKPIAKQTILYPGNAPMTAAMYAMGGGLPETGGISANGMYQDSA